MSSGHGGLLDTSFFRPARIEHRCCRVPDSPAVMPLLSPELILSSVAPVAFLPATGFALRKRAMVDETLRQGLMKVVLTVFFPALVLSKVTLNPALKDNAVALL